MSSTEAENVALSTFVILNETENRNLPETEMFQQASDIQPSVGSAFVKALFKTSFIQYFVAVAPGSAINFGSNGAAVDRANELG
jgi:hypothetical protein